MTTNPATLGPSVQACKHQHATRLPWFPGDAMFCRDCGAELKRPGYSGCIRDYYQPGDEPTRRHGEIIKMRWLNGENVTVVQCPACWSVGDIDDFDVMGADEGNLFCNECGVEFDSVEEPPQ